MASCVSYLFCCEKVVSNIVFFVLLFRDACRDYTVVSRANFKIFWLNTSKCCTQELILEKMHRLKVMLQAEDCDVKFSQYNGNTKNQIVHMRNHLRKLLEKAQFKNSLIVLVDVQDENICKAFYELPCKFLITTRHLERLEFIPHEKKNVIEINDGFTLEETETLFRKAFKNKILPNDMTEYINNFHSTCNGHPFILSLVAKSFHNFNESEVEREKRCANWIKSLSEYNLQDREDLLQMSMMKSMNFLKEEQQICYKMMVIFTDNRDVPFGVLERYWKKNPVETEAIIVRLQKYSLIETCMDDPNEKTCCLHYLHYHFLLQVTNKDERLEYHKMIIDCYEVDKVLRDRKDVSLDFPKDNYFHSYIPYHMIGADRKDLFKLYFDFDFLEQKMRFTKLVGTIGDLERFSEFIIAENASQEVYVDELIKFLANSERQIYESNDVSLLQIALNSSEIIQQRAKKQITKFPFRVWMKDINHGEQTQIIQIRGNSQPQIVRFVKLNDELVCLISLKDTDIFLQNIAHSYHNVAVLYKNEHQSKILDLQCFRDQCFLTLTENGKIAIYSLQHMFLQEFSSQNLVRSNVVSDSIVQRIDYEKQDEITCFTVTNDELSQVDLIIGTSSGALRFFSWKNRKFEEDKKLTIKSKFANLHRFVKVEAAVTNAGDNFNLNLVFEYLMLINKVGDIKFIDLKNSSEMLMSNEWRTLYMPIEMHRGHCKTLKRSITICVGKRKVVQVTHRQVFNGRVIDVSFDDIYTCDSDHDILSSAMSVDAKFVILGTTKGIFIVNRFDREIVMRKNISDKVLSLDIHHDEDAMYILSSIFEDSQQVINLHGFDENSEDYNKLLPILAGGDLFDVKKSSTSMEMVVFDDKKNIQFRNSSDVYKPFDKPFEQKRSKYDIKKLIYAGEEAILTGCINGKIIKFNAKGRQNEICSLASEISYLEMTGEVIVASCNSEYVIICHQEKTILKYSGKITKAFQYANHEIMLVKKDCSLEFFNSISNRIEKEKILAESEDEFCTAQAFSVKNVFVSSSKKRVYIWNFEESSEIKRIDLDDSSFEISALAVSQDNSVLAIGCSNGKIEVNNYLVFPFTKKIDHQYFNQFNFSSSPSQIVNLINGTSMTKLAAGTDSMINRVREINNLYFSPWDSPNDPLILLSVSNSLNFWNIKAVQNNSYLEYSRKLSTSNKLRVSSRFRSPLKMSSPLSVDDNLTATTQNLSLHNSNPWRNKTGSSDKPELLSCHKLIGKSAKKVIFNDDFDKFLTIDNEGNIYYLRLLNNDFTESSMDFSDNADDFDDNGNPMRNFQ